MNFFSHAAVAGRFSTRPAFFFGAMLPDFCSMLGLRTPELHDASLAAGVHFHHLTDHAFHELARFREFCREAARALDDRGVARGTARAVAHVGVELFLDGVFAENDADRSAYLAGLEAGRNGSGTSGMRWAEADGDARLLRLTTALAERGVVAKVSDQAMLERLERALARRPRLAIAPVDRERVAAWVELARPRVVASAPLLVAELTSELERRMAA
jgi:hypothetical protein